MSHGHGHKFYKENLDFFLQLFRYQYTFPFIVGVSVIAVIVAILVFIPPLKPFRMDLLLSFGIILGIGLVLMILGALWRVFFITGYTAAKWGGDLVEEEEEEFEIVGHAHNHLIKKIAILAIIGFIGIFLLRYFGIM